MRTRGEPAGNRVLGTSPLTEGQAVTVLIGVGLALLRAHRDGCCHGPLRPGDVLVDPQGRPGLRPFQSAPGWGPADDRDAWLRLAASLSDPRSRLRAVVSAWARDGAARLPDLLVSLPAIARPEPIVPTSARLRSG